ncbi:MAG: exodeoxyribonuclease VII large subunit [Pseudonocardiales bacterium]
MSERPTSAEEPWPVRMVAQKIAGWVARLGEVWVEGQVAQLTVRPGVATVYLTLRDPAAAVSLSVTCPRAVYAEVRPPLAEGTRVVVRARPEFYAARGSLHLRASEIRPVGAGALLARLEQLKSVMAAEGLFAADRKLPLPFLPRCVGLITGRASAAERDVLSNARARWPAVRFRVLTVAVQGAGAAGEVIEAIRTLDADPQVEVIVLARGGGSVEDLLTFSDEALCRTVAACRTPVVSAIGHEADNPLLDYVADLRASTPTDAGKRVVPDVAQEQRGLEVTLGRLRRVVRARIDREQHLVDALHSRPVLASPMVIVDGRATEVFALGERARRCLQHRLDRAAADLAHARAQVGALSPAATLRRGYAVVQQAGGHVVRDAAEVATDEALRVRLATGDLAVRVSGAARGPA